jgi:hypothetical protein
LPQCAQEFQNGHSAAKKELKDKWGTNGMLIKSALQLERKQKQKTKASPKDDRANVKVATATPRISKRSQRSQKEPRR